MLRGDTKPYYYVTVRSPLELGFLILAWSLFLLAALIRRCSLSGLFFALSSPFIRGTTPFSDLTILTQLILWPSPGHRPNLLGCSSCSDCTIKCTVYWTNIYKATPAITYYEVSLSGCKRQRQTREQTKDRLSTDRTSAYIIESYLYVFIFPRFSSSLAET